MARFFLMIILYFWKYVLREHFDRFVSWLTKWTMLLATEFLLKYDHLIFRPSTDYKSWLFFFLQKNSKKIYLHVFTLYLGNLGVCLPLVNVLWKKMRVLYHSSRVSNFSVTFFFRAMCSVSQGPHKNERSNPQKIINLKSSKVIMSSARLNNWSSISQRKWELY